MKPAAFTRAEGGKWIPFFEKGREDAFGKKNTYGPGGAVHSIVFENGAIFDTVNGWRRKPRIRAKMGREVVA